jgi:phosphate transport system substrate-binding protein
MNVLTKGLVAVSVVSVLGGVASAQQVTVDTALPSYKATEGVTGTIKSVGSDSMNNLMTLWGEEFKKSYPNAKIEIEGKGSSTAPAALIEGIAQFGPMSREMKKSEIDSFEKKFGYKPTALPTAVDALAVFVHKDCPLDEITMEQLKLVFSVEGKDMTWGDLGVKDAAFASKPIALYGRNSASGTYGFFKEHAMDKKDFKKSVKEQPGSSAVVQAIATDKFAMGYSGLGYKTADVKALKVAGKGGKAVAASAEGAYEGTYPLARYLYIYVNAKPGTALDPLRGEFVKFIYSREGQEVVVKDGFFPVKAETARETLKSVGVQAKF